MKVICEFFCTFLKDQRVWAVLQTISTLDPTRGSAPGTRELARNASSRFISGFTVIKQRLLGRKVGKMADDSEQEVTESISLDHEGLWKGKYFTLLKNCRQIEQVRLCSLRICQPPSEKGTLKVF